VVLDRCYKRVTAMNLKDICTRDLVMELRARDDVQEVVNERSMCNWSVGVDRGDLLVGKGEVIILAVEGLF